MSFENTEELRILADEPRLQSLFLLLFRQEGYFTSMQLAEELGVTSRTIKSDVLSLKQIFCTEEVFITSKPSKGYKLEVMNKEVENKIKQFFQIYPSILSEGEFDRRVRYIIRRLLSSEKPVKEEDIQAEISVSYSLNHEMQEVKKMLAKYDLYLKIRPHYGMYIEGALFKKIMLAVRMYRYFDKSNNHDFGIKAYNQLFDCDELEKSAISRTFYETIIHSRIVFSDINAERFIIYLLYFRNCKLQKDTLHLSLPIIDFDYCATDEYELVVEVLQKLKIKFKGFGFTPEVIQFLTYVAIFSTDLYRFVDCSKENYNTLIFLAEEIRNFILKGVSQYLQMDVFDDYTCLKDLLKIMIPISLKIKLGVSDSIDLRYKDFKNEGTQSLIRYYSSLVYQDFFRVYHYLFSKREQQLIFSTILGAINRITLSHRKLRLAIIAIDGRLATQPLKFNLQHYFSEFIERIETKVLYELETLENQNFDYYLCSDYGKKLNITCEPIFYIEEEMNEFKYMDSLKHIFFQAYDYDKKLPSIQVANINLKDKGTFSDLASETFIQNDTVQVHFDLSASEETFTIFHTDEEEVEERNYYISVKTQIAGDKQKLKMLVNIIDQIMTNPLKLGLINEKENISYSHFLVD
ncbi:MAG: HTH domain-containing protein [Tetragenococcus koreensis]|nr:HTH domain-containing protein [Tetragenococcus koreensis]MDN6194862.1 HTH domain-containing protein [Atopostipes suicloacalis]MDN6744046.1 HTH domain-containing protein [Tetragenococcus halophilus]MDN6270541.1 HTH domain-containing protein [Tetragenococcus koreensis]MDN6497394.1 HTH domain-containing protein [Tetragenococcus koreensis]